MSEIDIVNFKKTLKYCNNIADLLKKHNNSKSDYEQNFEFQLSTDMCIFQIGEISIHISENLKLKHTEIPWAAMRAMRNVHAHDYEIVDRNIMWSTLTQDIPNLKNKINKVLSNFTT